MIGRGLVTHFVITPRLGGPGQRRHLYLAICHFHIRNSLTPLRVCGSLLSPAREMIWSPSPKEEAPGPDVQLSALEIDTSTVRKLFGGSEPSSDLLSNTPQGALAQEPLEDLSVGSSVEKGGGLYGVEHGESISGFR